MAVLVQMRRGVSPRSAAFTCAAQFIALAANAVSRQVVPESRALALARCHRRDGARVVEPARRVPAALSWPVSAWSRGSCASWRSAGCVGRSGRVVKMTAGGS